MLGGYYMHSDYPTKSDHDHSISHQLPLDIQSEGGSHSNLLSHTATSYHSISQVRPGERSIRDPSVWQSSVRTSTDTSILSSQTTNDSYHSISQVRPVENSIKMDHSDAGKSINNHSHLLSQTTDSYYSRYRVHPGRFMYSFENDSVAARESVMLDQSAALEFMFHCEIS